MCVWEFTSRFWDPRPVLPFMPWAATKHKQRSPFGSPFGSPLGSSLPSPCCPLSPFSRAHLSSPPSLAPEDAPWVSWAASDGFWSGWHPHLGCARRRRPASGQSWSHHGTWDRPGRDADALEGRGSRATGFGTPGDENFLMKSKICDLV